MSRFKKLFVILAALVTASAASSNPYFQDGNKLHAACQSDVADMRYLGCEGYIRGVLDGSNATNNPLYCWPEEATLGQAVDIVKKWLGDNPGLRTMSGGAIVVVALKEAFPSKVMWQPRQRDENGRWAALPLTPEKSTAQGQWVAACNGKYKYEFSNVLSFVMGLPENYKLGRAWMEEMINGPE